MFVLGLWESNRVYDCVWSLIWDTGLMGVNHRETKKKEGRKGQNEIQEVWQRQREGEKECDVSKNQRVNRKCHVAMLLGCGKRVIWQLQLTAKIRGEAVFIVLKVFCKKMWIISEDKVRLLFLVGFERGMETEKGRHRKRLNTSLRQPPNWSHYCVTSWWMQAALTLAFEI